MKVSCVIPAYNEELSIRNIINNVKKVKTIDEIIVVDDGSTDKTYERAKKTGVKVIRHNKNRGKGAAIKTGLKYSKADVVIFLDADIMKLDLKKVENMINLIRLNKADVVIGTFKFRVFQTFTEVVYKPLMNLFFPDVMEKINQGYLSGQRAFRRDVLNRIKLRDGFDLETGMNIEMSFLKPDIKIKFVNLGDIKVRPKGYQKSMEIIAKSILYYASKYKRLDRLKSSSIAKVSRLLYKSVNKLG